MTTEIRVLDSEDDLVAAANLFRAAMVGFPPLSNLAPGRITTRPARACASMPSSIQRATSCGGAGRVALPRR